MTTGNCPEVSGKSGVQEVISQLVAIAAVAEAACYRYRHGRALPPAAKDMPASHATVAESRHQQISRFFLALSVRNGFNWSRNPGAVAPLPVEGTDSHQKESDCFNAPIQEDPALCHVLEDPDRLSPCIPSAPNATTASGQPPSYNKPDASRLTARIREQAGDILTQLQANLAIPRNNLKSTAHTREIEPREDHGEEATSFEERNLDYLDAVLENKPWCERFGIEEGGSLHHTMLFCEGLAVNLLFNDGSSSRMVWLHAVVLHPCL
jgi:hypothetical protein